MKIVNEVGTSLLDGEIQFDILIIDKFCFLFLSNAKASSIKYEGKTLDFLPQYPLVRNLYRQNRKL